MLTLFRTLEKEPETPNSSSQAQWQCAKLSSNGIANTELHNSSVPTRTTTKLRDTRTDWLLPVGGGCEMGEGGQKTQLPGIK